MPSRNFENLALAVHRNADGAVELLVRSYQDGLFNYALRLLRNSFDAQEVTQDAFVRACRALTARYDDARCRKLALRPWLFRITRNLAHNRRRQRVLQHEISLAELAESATGCARRIPAADLALMRCPASIRDSGAERTLELRERSETLQTALGRLGSEAQDLIALRFLEEMPYADIAAIVGTSEASVRGKAFRALRKLRGILIKTGGGYAL